MATEYFEAVHTNSKTVYFQFYDPSADKLFDFDDDTWQASPTTKKLAATEKTSMGDADESLYVASTDLANMHNTATPKRIVVQAVDDLGTDELIATGEFWIVSGARIEPADITHISGDSTAANNCELMFDGTGYAGGTTKLAVDSSTALKASTGWTAGGTATLATIIKCIYAMAQGKYTVSGDDYTFYDDDDATSVYTLTITTTQRTSS